MKIKLEKLIIRINKFTAYKISYNNFLYKSINLYKKKLGLKIVTAEYYNDLYIFIRCHLREILLEKK